MCVCRLLADISQKYVAELKYATLERTRSVDLDPDIEALCTEDLARFCSHKMQENEVSPTLYWFWCKQFVILLSLSLGLATL